MLGSTALEAGGVDEVDITKLITMDVVGGGVGPNVKRFGHIATELDE